MSGIYHEWNGTVLTITSDSGTSSADLKGDDGCRGPQGPGGGQYFPEKGKDYMTPEEIEEIAEVAAGMVSQPIDEIREEITSIYEDMGAMEADKASKAYADTVANSAKRNVNILDNWDFRNPVNQRGATTYTGEGFCIDRWYFEQWSNTNPQLVLNDGYITLSCTDAKNDTNTTCIKQTIEGSKFLSGKTVTLSVKFKNIAVDGEPRIIIRSIGASGTKYAYKNITADCANTIMVLTTTLQEDITNLLVVIGNYANQGGDGNFTIEIESAKLEVGGSSTLGYDAPAKYAEQLIRCQRFFVAYKAATSTQFASGATNGSCAYAPVYLPVPLYGGVDATVTSKNVNIYAYKSGSNITPTSVNGYTGSSRNFFTLQAYHATNTDLPAQTPCNIRLGADSYIYISAEL